MRPTTPSFDWREWLATLPAGVQFQQPAPNEAVRAIERRFRIELHDHLRVLLSVSNGVLSPAGYWLVWPAEMMLAENHKFRTEEALKSHYMPFDHLLFVGEAPNGDLFGYPISADGNARHRTDIFMWGHETDVRLEAASSLRSYIQGVLNGSIEV